MCDPFFWIGNTLRSFCFRLSHRSPLGLCLKCNHFGNVPSIRVSLARLAAQSCSTRSLFRMVVSSWTPGFAAHRAEGKRGPQPSQAPAAEDQASDGDLARDGKLLKVECSACRPSRHLYIEPLSLGLPKRLAVPEVANHLVTRKAPSLMATSAPSAVRRSSIRTGRGLAA